MGGVFEDEAETTTDSPPPESADVPESGNTATPAPETVRTNGTLTASETVSSTATESPSSTPAPTPDDRTTPPADFRQQWPYDDDTDWNEESRQTQYPTTDEAAEWNPVYARTATYTHLPSRENLADLGTDRGTMGVPPLRFAVTSKWKVPDSASYTLHGLINNVEGWFDEQFDPWPIRDVDEKSTHANFRELDSGEYVGLRGYDGQGNTGELSSPFTVTVAGDSIEVTRISFDVEGALFARLPADEGTGYLVGEMMPEPGTISLHSAESDEVDVDTLISIDVIELRDRLYEKIGMVVD